MLLKADIHTPEIFAKVQLGDVIAIDFETYYTGTYSVATMGTFAYCHDERFNPYLVAAFDGINACVCDPAAFPWHKLNGAVLVSHNRDFDQAVFERLQQLGRIPDWIKPAQWHCTAALAAFLQYPRSLAGACQQIFGVHLDKSIRDAARDYQPGTELFRDRELERYASKDAVACWMLWEKHNRLWPEHERELYRLTSCIGRKGVPVNWSVVEDTKAKLQDLVASIEAVLPWSPPGSVAGFNGACLKQGIKPPRSTSVTSPDFKKWLDANTTSKAAEWAQHMQRWRSSNRTLQVINAMLERRKPDGRMAYELKYFGAAPGRWSGGGGLNLQNLNREGDLRRVIAAPKGKILAAVDYSQIESRVLLYLAGDQVALAMFKENYHADAYEIHARATMGYSDPRQLKTYCEQTGSNIRHLAKARVLGLGFGCGWQKFIEVARVLAGLEIAAEESKQIVKDFRKSNPAITRLWNSLEAAARAQIGNSYQLPLPSKKRSLFYRDIEEDMEGNLQASVAGRRVNLYGGLLAENWTQATARDVLASAWLRCRRAGYTPILSVHDELVFEFNQDSAEADLAAVRSIMETPLAWAPTLPLRADGQLMDYYAK